jgi:AcrR family transcriptional regulator
VTAVNSTARPRNRRGEGGRLRGEILAAASALLEETGSEDAVTLRAVARRAGITAPAIYGHFADRDAMLDEVVRDAFAELTAAVGDAAARWEDPLERLHGACRAYVAFAQERPHRYRVLFGRNRGPGQLETSSMTKAKAMDDLLGAQTFGVLVDAVSDCVEAGYSHSEQALYDATALWVALHGYATLHASVPAFPWPPEEELLTTLVTRLARVEPA